MSDDRETAIFQKIFLDAVSCLHIYDHMMICTYCNPDVSLYYLYVYMLMCHNSLLLNKVS